MNLSDETKKTVTLTASVLPENATEDKTVTWSSDHTEIATVAAGVVTAVAIGSATITATVGTKTATCVVTVKKDATIPVATITEEIAKTADDDTVVEVSGIVAKVYDNTKGNFYLSDPTSGDQITVFGSSAVASNFVKTDTGKGYYTGVFTNVNDFSVSGSPALVAGDYVTLNAVFTSFGSAKIPELSGYIASVVHSTDAAYTYKFKAFADAATNGSVTLSKEADLAWGETVTVTTTPATGYKVDSVVVKHGAYYSESLTAASDGTYSFAANAYNDVVVTFVDAIPASLASYSTGFEADDGFTLSTTYNSTTEKVDGAEGKQWGIYYGTVSSSNKISGGSSLQLRWYASTATAIPYAYTKFNVAKVKGITFKAYVASTALGIDVMYSSDYGSTWSTLKSFAPGAIATSATAYSADFAATQDQCRIKFQITGTAPASSSLKIVFDDFAFVTE